MSEKFDLVSIILPAYNCGDFLLETLNSVKMQTYQNIELIVTNDSSTDNTLQILKDFQKHYPNLKIIENKYGKGIAGALNSAIDVASGKYIARIDGDDLCLPDRIEKQLKFMEENDLHVCGSAMKLFGIVDGVKNYPCEDIEIRTKVFTENPFGHPSVVFRLGLLAKKVIYYNHEFKGLEDVELWVRLMGIVGLKFGNHTEALIKYRVHATQKSRTDEKSVVKNDLGNIVAKLVGLLNIIPTDKEIELHVKNWYSQPFLSKDELEVFKTWIEEIYSVNTEKQVFNEEMLIKHLGLYWFRACSQFTIYNGISTGEILTSINMPYNWYKLKRHLIKYWVRDKLLKLMNK